MKKRDQSPAVALLRLVWSSRNEETRHSWERVNQAMYLALRLAICAGFRFDHGDFGLMDNEFRFEFWGGADAGGFAEGLYADAVAADNLSAALAFEAWARREPIIADDVAVPRAMFRHGGGRRQKSRLCLGATFTWRGETVTVTSMASGKTACIACCYDHAHGGRLKVKHRWEITPALVRADRAERKERAAIHKRALALVTAGWDAKTVSKRLGVAKKEDFLTAPIRRLRRAIEAMEGEQAKKTR